MANISAVINILNEERNIEKALKSVEWADEIVLVDDGSTDGTLEIVKRIKNHESRIKIFKHKSAGYVEPARNFAISKASGEWILILDADEEISKSLAQRLQEIAEKMREINYVEIPRKNIIFNKWMKASMWWPDHHVRFFRKGTVSWNEKIHSKPETKGSSLNLEPIEKWAIIHNNYESIYQFVERLNRYSTIQAKELAENDIRFRWTDLVEKPLSEFLSRFFSNKGYQDGVHGLVLSLLQAFSFIVVYTKLWEIEKFKEEDIKLGEIQEIAKKSGTEIKYWIDESFYDGNFFKRFAKKIKNKL